MKVKNKVLYILLILSFMCMQSAFSQDATDAGSVVENTPETTEISPDANPTTEETKPVEENAPKTTEISPDANPTAEETKPEQASSEESAEATNVLVKSFDINESKILSKEEIDGILNPIIGQTVGIKQLQELKDQLNKLYVDKGFITARAYLPPQTIKDGVVQIKLIEGHIGAINIEGNKWTRQAYILGKIKQKPGELFDIKALEKDVLKFNRENAVQLRANLKPGQEVGTTDINLVADEPFNFHVVPTFDNTGRETVGVLRGGISFAADSVFGYRDPFVMGYSRARSTDVAFSSYSFPIGNRGTRLGGNFSFSNIKITEGPFKSFNIEGNSYNYSGFVSQSFISTRKFDFSGDLTANFRQVTTFFDEIPLFTTQVRSLSAGLNFAYRDKWGNWSSRHSFDNGLDLLGGNVRFFKYNGSLTRIQNFGHGVLGIFRGAVQLTDDMLPPVEQFQLGGSSTVRGYSEGLLIGDNGYFLSGELRIPLPLPKKIGKLVVRDNIRGVLFVDHGGAFPDDGENSSPHHTDFLTSVGFGLRGMITKYINGRVDWGFGLGRREDPQPTARLHFGLEANPI